MGASADDFARRWIVRGEFDNLVTGIPVALDQVFQRRQVEPWRPILFRLLDKTIEVAVTPAIKSALRGRHLARNSGLEIADGRLDGFFSDITRGSPFNTNNCNQPLDPFRLPMVDDRKSTRL